MNAGNRNGPKGKNVLAEEMNKDSCNSESSPTEEENANSFESLLINED